jgi:N4-gp56 family major capsid protein
MAMTGTGTIPINIEGFYDRNLLERTIQPALLHNKFGQLRPLPKNMGSKITFRRYGSLAANTTQLTEGTTPAGKVLSSTEISATMGQYGDFVIITDKLLDMGLDPILVEAGEILGDQAGLSLDTIYRAVLLAGTSVRYAGGVAARANIIKTIQKSDIQAAIRNLEQSNARKIRSMITPSVKVSTTPLRPGYIAITHTDCRQDFENLADFIPVEKYSSQKDVMEEEIGEIFGVRVLVTTNASIVADAGGTAVTNGLVYTTANTACDVYQTLILAKDAYGIIPLQKGNIENIVKKAQDSGTEDPLNQRSTSGWKAYTTAKILNDNYLIRIEHGVTDL